MCYTLSYIPDTYFWNTYTNTSYNLEVMGGLAYPHTHIYIYIYIYIYIITHEMTTLQRE